VFVCQPASGCHPTGGLCREDTDCCGAAGTGLPGDGRVTCEKASGQTVGVCRNPTGCNPQGNVCHYKDYACNVSSARNSCCDGTGNSGVCQLDRLGVPRCNGLGDSCRPEGETCASSDDCCDDRPCIAGRDGILRCDGASCVPSGGSCTITGDCCRGSSCVISSGSLRGTCSVPPVSQPAAGSGGAGGSGGVGGASAGTGGTAGSEPGTSGQPAPQCSQYGQSCATATDCCDSTVCSAGYCIVSPQ
jgi:hypothetical protein